MSRAALFLVGANALAWVLFLGTRPATPWAELEARRPHVAPGGISVEHNTAWGTPLFGREVGGHHPQSKAASLFRLLNAPALFASVTAFEMLELTSMSIALVSFIAGAVAVLVSCLQWLAVGQLWGRRHRALPAA